MSTISHRLGNMPLGKFHWRLLVFMGSGIAFEALDTGLIAFVLAKMIGSWNLTPVQIGYIGSAGLLGMALGAILSGTLADRFGRKKLFVATLVFYSIGTALCGLAWSLESLLAFRFLVGAGVGGQPPVANALMGEFAPIKHRGKMLVLQNSSWAFGWLLAAVISYMVIPHFGWQLAFFIGSLPVVLVYYLWKKLPESPMYLMSKGRYDEAHQLVAGIEQEMGVPVGEKPKANAQEAMSTAKISFADLWSAPYIRRTVCLWILWFGMVFSYYGIFTWLPSLLVKSGHTLLRSFEFIMYMTVAQIPGYFTAAYLVDKIGRKPTMGGLLVLCAVSAYMFGHATTTTEILLWGCLMSFSNLGAWGITHTYSSEQYPTFARATGVGWAAACGRMGGIAAPIVVGTLMTGTDQFNTVFMMFTVVLAAVALNIIFLGRETAGKLLDELTGQQPAQSAAK